MSSFNGTEPGDVPPLTEDQLAFMTEQTRLAASAGIARALKRWAVGATIAYLVLLGGVFIALFGQQQRLQEGLDGSCDRVNVLRAQSNSSDLVSFRILSYSGQREARLARLTTGEEAEAHRSSAQALFLQAQKLTVTALTDCKEAVQHPQTFKTPIAGSIGDPTTGKLNGGIQEIVDDSQSYVRDGKVR